VAPNTVYRWETSLLAVPAWVEKMVVLLKKIEAQEKEISELLLQIHRNSPRAERLSLSAARPGAARGGDRAARV
jgi:hypothetical protein